VIETFREEPLVVHRGALTFDEFAARMKVAARRAHRELRHPDGDIAPRAWFYFADRTFEMQLVGEWFSSRGTKDLLTEGIVKMVRVAPMLGRVGFGEATPVKYVGRLDGMFRSLVAFDGPEGLAAFERNEMPPGHPPPSEAPNREEMISAMVLDREIVKVWHGRIIRSRKKPPRLGPWEDMDATGWNMPVGLMIDPIREAMR
jgi:hypothetical protein